MQNTKPITIHNAIDMATAVCENQEYLEKAADCRDKGLEADARYYDDMADARFREYMLEAASVVHTISEAKPKTLKPTKRFVDLFKKHGIKVRAYGSLDGSFSPCMNFLFEWVETSSPYPVKCRLDALISNRDDDADEVYYDAVIEASLEATPMFFINEWFDDEGRLKPYMLAEEYPCSAPDWNIGDALKTAKVASAHFGQLVNDMLFGS